MLLWLGPYLQNKYDWSVLNRGEIISKGQALATNITFPSILVTWK
uniref:Uncharacterized protein n=1 Tax=Anguilla anguilla TaxID=7936 RepID=A0A0E9VZZ3_ANGAN